MPEFPSVCNCTKPQSFCAKVYCTQGGYEVKSAGFFVIAKVTITDILILFLLAKYLLIADHSVKMLLK